MYGAVIHARCDLCLEEPDDPTIISPIEAVFRLHQHSRICLLDEPANGCQATDQRTATEALLVR
jgi:hypothetical protein